MKNIIIRNLRIGKNIYAVNLFSIVFSRGKLSPVIANHEYIHTLQQREMLFIFFYIWYILEWIVKSVYYLDTNKGYENIGFEREAYLQQNNLSYPSQRRHYAWFKYLIIKNGEKS